MKRTQELFENIESYLKHDLTEEARSAFEQELQQDPALAKEVELHKALQVLQEPNHVLQFREAFAKVKEEAKTNNVTQESTAVRKEAPVRQLNWRLPVGIAASLLLLVTLVILVTNPNKPSTNNELLAGFYEPYPLNLTVRNGNNMPQQPQSINGAANAAYAAKRYDTAILLWSQLAATQELPVLSRLYMGSALIALDSAEGAITQLDRFLQDTTALLNDAKWYLALAYIKNDQLSKARPVLQELINKRSRYAKESQALLRRL